MKYYRNPSGKLTLVTSSFCLFIHVNQVWLSYAFSPRDTVHDHMFYVYFEQECNPGSLNQKEP